MRLVVLVVVLAGCVRVGANEPGPLMLGFMVHPGAAKIDDSSPDAGDDTPSAYGAHLAWFYKLYPTFAVGLGLDSTVLDGTSADGHDMTYASYGGALTSRIDTGRFAVSTFAAYYVGERNVLDDGSSYRGRELDLKGPGVGMLVAIRLGITDGFSLEAGPYARFYYLRFGGDDMTTELDERNARVRSFVFGISIGALLGGPPISRPSSE